MSLASVSLSSFKVKSYRRLDGLDLPSLTQVNVVTGINGVGKTSVLEALWLFTGRYNAPILWNQNIQRSSELPFNPVAPLTSNGHVGFVGIENGKEFEHTVAFSEYLDAEYAKNTQDDSQAAENLNAEPVVGHLDATINGEELPRQKFRRTPGGLVATAFKPVHRNPVAIEGTRWALETSEYELRRFSDLVEAGNKDDLRKAMLLIHPEIVDIEILSSDQGPYLSGVSKNGRRYPLQAFGGGLTRLFRLYLTTFSCRNSVVLIDEIENGIHHEVLTDMWRRIRNWTSGWNVQLFATTHSSECLQAAIEAFHDDEQKLTVHNLHWRDGDIKTATFSGETLKGAHELGIELR